MPRFRCVWLLPLALLIVFAKPSAQGQQSASTGRGTEANLGREVDAIVKEQLRRQRIPGLSLAVVLDGKTVKLDGYGFANVETNTPATPETRYKIASVGKTIVGAATMLLVQTGKIRLDDTAGQFLPTVPAHWRPITIRQLLSHTSGLIENPPGFKGFEVRPLHDLVASGYSHSLLFRPGDSYQYSNLAFFVMAEILEKITGERWDRFIDQTILKPAGMTATRLTTTTELVAQRADGYLMTFPSWTKAEDWVAVRPSGPFLSNVIDLVKWSAFLDSETVLKRLTLETMWTPVTLNDGKVSRYGIGWDLNDWQGHKRQSHGGHLPGFCSAFARFPDDKLTVVVLANSDKANVFKIAHQVAGVYVPSLTPPILKPIPETDPEFGNKARRLIEGLCARQVDDGLLTKAATLALAKSTLGDELRFWGPVQKVELVGSEEKSERRINRYRVGFHEMSLLVRCEFNRDGKISEVESEVD